MAEPLLQVGNLRIGFGRRGAEQLAVDGVSFRLDAGEVLGIVGESGCGKSVTALSLLGLVPDPPGRVVGGSIRLRGRELVGLDEAALNQVRGKDVSMIFQEPMTALNPLFTVGEQIGETLRVHERLGRREAKGRALALLRKVGISHPEHRIDQYPHELSGGMRQRVMIAIALACGPQVLIADEPTTALDVTIQAQILALLRDLQRELGMGVVLITHDLGVVAQVVDRVIVMYAGRIVEEGSVRSVFEQPSHPYTRLLLESIPAMDGEQDRLPTIAGMVPSLAQLPRGCRFHPRCPQAHAACREGVPAFVEVGAGHRAACFALNGATHAV
ncbi:ABC transporter ATP-binding protein [Ramlibacter sp.]|uniref:ABC transporter ATP-binding protein n=1 Tax=Ramlibacter sp. TaxID=1917967 RepID=UPI002C28F9AC|nr:ABC transporter ATP-binding protein [Ramlibacter sp.]HWI84222.1 ABC transporter ATP-binding protein [Ramlibacter sp.]